MQGFENSLRSTQHYIVFRIGADTDIFNGRIGLVQETLKKLEAREDYIACQALYDALQYHSATVQEETETAA
jgi:hypothetical protein